MGHGHQKESHFKNAPCRHSRELSLASFLPLFALLIKLCDLLHRQPVLLRQLKMNNREWGQQRTGWGHSQPNSLPSETHWEISFKTNKSPELPPKITQAKPLAS